MNIFKYLLVSVLCFSVLLSLVNSAPLPEEDEEGEEEAVDDAKAEDDEDQSEDEENKEAEEEAVGESVVQQNTLGILDGITNTITGGGVKTAATTGESAMSVGTDTSGVTSTGAAVAGATGATAAGAATDAQNVVTAKVGATMN